MALCEKAFPGDFQPLPNKPPGNGHQITDWEKFREFALSHGDKTRFRDGLTLGRTNQRCLLFERLRQRRASLTHDLTSAEENWLHSKKKTYGYRERDEGKRQAFVAQLSTLSVEKIVYLDESGMDNPACL